MEIKITTPKPIAVFTRVITNDPMPMSFQKGCVAFLYHDVIPSEYNDESGYATQGSWRYKLSPKRFQNHLDRLKTKHISVSLVSELTPDFTGQHVLLTFDDGGQSLADYAAPIMENEDLRGHIFIITDFVGQPGYLDRSQIQELSNIGHHIGSHTRTHPNLKSLSPIERKDELLGSKKEIESITGRNCESLSIPGGAYNEEVVNHAFQLGYSNVFTSKPLYHRSFCLKRNIIGRWNIWHDTGAEEVEKIITGDILYQTKRQTRYYFLRSLKNVIGRERLIGIRNKIFFS